MAHDFNKFPELTNNQMQFYYFDSPHQQIAEDFEAKVVRVIDGDTIQVSTNFRDFDFTIRMLDINAPELNEGGRDSKSWLTEQILGKVIFIEIEPKNRVGKFGRLLGRVIESGMDVGQLSLQLGFSRPFGTEIDVIPNLNKELARAIPNGNS